MLCPCSACMNSSQDHMHVVLLEKQLLCQSAVCSGMGADEGRTQIFQIADKCEHYTVQAQLLGQDGNQLLLSWLEIHMCNLASTYICSNLSRRNTSWGAHNTALWDRSQVWIHCGSERVLFANILVFALFLKGKPCFLLQIEEARVKLYTIAIPNNDQHGILRAVFQYKQ